MAKITLINESQISPVPQSSHAGRTCYEADMPSFSDGKEIDIKSRLFDTGHHTTLEHNYFTFAMEDISVSTITFGFHLAHPFYNSDQRSGRFSKLYDNPDLSDIEKKLKSFFPKENPDQALEFINFGINVFQKNKDALTNLAGETLKKERPNVTEKYVEQNAKKMAQEQLRVFISTIVPTAMDHTIDLVTLCALWRVAWSPEMLDATEQMKDAVILKHPEIAYMFDEKVKSDETWHPTFIKNVLTDLIKYQPSLKLIKDKNIDKNWAPFIPKAKDAVDILPFHPKAMNNNLFFNQGLRTEVEMAVMTMGQDQRHRTIIRGTPEFTNEFYLPTMLKLAWLENDAEIFINKFKKLQNQYSGELITAISPYGAVVRYGKNTGINALLHEQAKRLCWCAQEEIYNLNIQLMQELRAEGFNNLANELMPHCEKYGKCIEGVRCCGRNFRQNNQQRSI